MLHTLPLALNLRKEAENFELTRAKSLWRIIMAADPITAGLNLAGKFVDKFVKDKDLAAKLASNEYAMEFTGELQVMLAQIQVNMEEAKSGSLFKGGWRPGCGWTCVLALFYNTILQPIFVFAAAILMPDPPVLPVVDLTVLMPVLMGMLGLGAMRSYEKKSGVAAK
mgnify:FL=1|jgi:hypothetical protein|tara:strand:+ start:1012 stop:1512 length:501 start_codon:yes stop_codon:yes gene_type:complete